MSIMTKFEVRWSSRMQGTPDTFQWVEHGYDVLDEDGDVIAFVPVTSWDLNAEIVAAFGKQGFLPFFGGTANTVIGCDPR